ncbi:hypothetical protein FZC84_03865 [Rossellomorea vietnamensis]|uniref:Uncharacterized protein n=1 Tax=Rossellomorea vietnamensis TaxID=218284 RepID=A0A5D4MG10_9BACI|nr:hypothetical protein [Rossellomorea vietnamensis]TYS00643.1 hypothetical protein FZC84_03865 [Rossellomorea vietnamensis]
MGKLLSIGYGVNDRLEMAGGFLFGSNSLRLSMVLRDTREEKGVSGVLREGDEGYLSWKKGS